MPHMQSNLQSNLFVDQQPSTQNEAPHAAPHTGMAASHAGPMQPSKTQATYTTHCRACIYLLPIFVAPPARASLGSVGPKHGQRDEKPGPQGGGGGGGAVCLPRGPSVHPGVCR
mmetsp:Transcript_7532/g.16352  ORF Transcript_7532/g.16352 Transcript_7532/m.16352 type:complete len:114 (-) Transcript_7532:773-1114(-)